ncbi:hypothetical protein RJ55_05589 [Drechmeria coniospora]|nr:hypothetical protein RJ55_05589 [Drechmeria coniospora]
MSRQADPEPISLQRQRPGGACEECRRRKLRCDRQQPQCGMCSAAGATCQITTNRAPRGPKRGYLKAMQARIGKFPSPRAQPQALDPLTGRLDGHAAALEGALEGAMLQQQAGGDKVVSPYDESWSDGLFPVHDGMSWDFPVADAETLLHDLGRMTSIACPPFESSTESQLDGAETAHSASPLPAFDGHGDEPLSSAGSSSSPGTAEGPGLNGPGTPCISSLMQAELDQLYFDRMHAFTPIVHEGRYSAWARQPRKAKARLCLQYTLWTSASSASAHYQNVGGSLYREARRLMEELEEEAKGRPAAPTELEHIQAWLLLAIHEFIFVDFRRGWLSAGRAFRLIQLDWFRDVDGLDAVVAPAQWIEAEQRRRTYWMAYCLDRLVSLRSGSPLTFDEQTVVRLPAPETAFQNDEPVLVGYLGEAVASHDASATSPFTECIVMATLTGRALSYQHLATKHPKVSEDFWYRHRGFDAVLTQRMEAFTLKYGLALQEADPMLMFVGMMWRTTILFFSQTMERAMAPASENGFVASDHAARSSSAAEDVVGLTAKLAQLNWFKVHPLTPIPLSLCAKLLAAQNGLDKSTDKKLAIVTDLMRSLVNFNNMGKGLYSYPW